MVIERLMDNNNEKISRSDNKKTKKIVIKVINTRLVCKQQKKKKVCSWGGWVGGWMNGWESHFKDC